jgi:hypothetical protein
VNGVSIILPFVLSMLILDIKNSLILVQSELYMRFSTRMFSFRYPERMCLCVKHIVVQTNQIGLAGYQVQILDGFSSPETLHEVGLYRLLCHDVRQFRVAVFGSCLLFNRLEHLPSHVLAL